jgi:hypothetical protein
MRANSIARITRRVATPRQVENKGCPKSSYEPLMPAERSAFADGGKDGLLAPYDVAPVAYEW